MRWRRERGDGRTLPTCPGCKGARSATVYRARAAEQGRPLLHGQDVAGGGRGAPSVREFGDQGDGDGDGCLGADTGHSHSIRTNGR